MKTRTLMMMAMVAVPLAPLAGQTRERTASAPRARSAELGRTSR